MKQVCIVIPVHKMQPDDHEIISLQKCQEVLNAHDIFLVAPEGLDLTAYLQVSRNFIVKYVAPQSLSSIKAYNKMKIDYEFYALFKDYNYLLTYETDAYVFRDELSFWCNKGKDYVGAPWFTGYHQEVENAIITGVGNSGFSLRNIQKCLSILAFLKKSYSRPLLNNLPFSRELLRILTFFTSKFPVTQARFYVMRAFLRNEYVHEDIFWCKFVPLLVPEFKIASVKDALNFSFDASPRKCFQLNGEILPFGCHAFHKFDLEFWSRFIPYCAEHNKKV
jgi:hypothetical protein